MDGNPRDPWVCPNDRQLALRAKLHSGWSVKTKQMNNCSSAAKVQQQQQPPLNSAEQEMVVTVIKRAEHLVTNEQQRVKKLLDRVRNIQKNAIGDGVNQCILCGDCSSIWSGTSHVTCKDCQKSVCGKCSVNTSLLAREPSWLCKLCSERREIWKKSGAWFYK